jgi:raffinose/stachyose/melibiose transport system substrate-binding protein
MEQVWLKQISSEDYLKTLQVTFAKEMADGKVPEIAAR